MFSARRLLLLSLFLANPGPCFADQSATQETLLDSTTGGESAIQVHAFLSQGYMETTENNYLPTSKEGTTDFAEAGVTLDKQITGNLRGGLQLFARDFGRTGNFDTTFDWFLLDYRWKDWLGFRAGRVKIPYALYNETNDIDMARTPILLPQSVYPTDQRDFLLAQTGLTVYGYFDLPKAGAIGYNLYRGTLKIPPGPTVGLPYEVATSDVPYIQGGRLSWETPLEGLRLVGSYQNLQLNSDLFIPSLVKTISTTLKVTMGVGSIEYTAHDFQFAAEYAKWWGDFDSNLPAVLVPTSVTHERYYAMATFRAKEWLHPGIYDSITYPNTALRGEIQDYTKDIALFCRLDLTQNWILKAQWDYIDGTAGLTPQMNDNKTPDQMQQYWQMFMAKTTIYF